MAKKRLGIIQSRGLGDLIITLPIAHYYYKEGWDIYWPICEEFVSSMKPTAPWVNWIPIPFDRPGRYFYDVPMERLRNFRCDEILPLYQALTGHPEFSNEIYFQYTKFDQYKYIRAGVPFHHKWQLNNCITRDLDREQTLYNRVVTNPNYAILHLQGWDHKAQFDPSIIPQDWAQIEITPMTDNIFDWLTVIERAQSIIMVDSSMANLVDQLGLGDDRYFIPRSHIGLTPVQGHHWHWIKT